MNTTIRYCSGGCMRNLDELELADLANGACCADCHERIMEQDASSDEARDERLQSEPPRRRLGDLAAIARFALAGHAIFTLSNVTNGKRFTYKFSAGDPREGERPEQAPIFVSVLTGPSNESDYELVAMIFRREPGELSWRYFDGTWGAKKFRARISEEAPSVRGARWLLERIREHRAAPILFGDLDERFEVHHEGRCGRCGRLLTVPESVEQGLGPECAKREG